MLCKKYCAGGTSYQSNLVPLSITDRTILHASSHICHCQSEGKKSYQTFYSPLSYSPSVTSTLKSGRLLDIKKLIVSSRIIFLIFPSLFLPPQSVEVRGSVALELASLVRSQPGSSLASLNSHYHGWIYFNNYLIGSERDTCWLPASHWFPPPSVLSEAERD